MDGYHIIIHPGFPEPELISVEELLEITGINFSLLNYFLEFGLIEPARANPGDLFFNINVIPRIRMIQRLRSEVGVNLSGIAIILDLKDQIQQLQRELEWYKSY